MREIKIEKLTLETFKLFGSFSELLNPVSYGNGAHGMTFYPDLEVLELGMAHAASFSITRVTNKKPPIIVALEQHSYCGEGIIALDQDMIVYFAPAGTDIKQAIHHIKAFYVPACTMLVIRPGVWHCMPFPAKADAVNVLNVLPERTYANDCRLCILEEKDRVKLI